MRKNLGFGLVVLALVACGGNQAREPVTDVTVSTATGDAGATAVTVTDTDSPPEVLVPEAGAGESGEDASGDAGLDSGSVADADDGGVDCNGDHHTTDCAAAGSAKVAWGFDARCDNPYRYHPFLMHRLNGTQFCDPYTTAEGLAILCCNSGGDR